MYNRKIKYWAIIFVVNRPIPLKYRMISKDFRSLYYWLQKNGYQWTAINVYERLPHSGRGPFIMQLTNNNYWSKIKYL